MNIVRYITVPIDFERGVGAGAFGAGLVGEHVVDIEHREIRHLLLCHDGDRRGEVLQVRVEPRARHRVTRVVTVVGLLHFERGELNGWTGGLATLACDRDSRRPLLVRLARGFFRGVQSTVFVGVVSGQHGDARTLLDGLSIRDRQSGAAKQGQDCRD